MFQNSHGIAAVRYIVRGQAYWYLCDAPDSHRGAAGLEYYRTMYPKPLPRAGSGGWELCGGGVMPPPNVKIAPFPPLRKAVSSNTSFSPLKSTTTQGTTEAIDDAGKF